MKILSKTIDEGRVVEFTRDEWLEFAKLAEAIEGKTEQEAHWHFNMTRDREIALPFLIDFSGVFGAILAFRQANFYENELRQLVDQLGSYLKDNAKKVE